MRLSKPITVAFLLLGTLDVTFAQLSNTEVERSELQSTETVFTEEALAEHWRLSLDEWTRYRTLMEGPRGTWSPSLDPVTVLGIHAETEAERRRYAELLVMLEFERVEQELRFQRAYDEAARRLFPALLPVSVSDTQAAQSPVPGAERLAFFGSIDPERCPSCEDEFARLIGAQRAENAPALDLFLADAADDEAIRAWASRQGVDPVAVRLGRITLNHARGPLSTPAMPGPMAPRILRRTAEQWLPR